MGKITDHFKVGDNVEWISVKKIGSSIELKKHNGVIDEIRGSMALISSPYFKRRRIVSLFELDVIENAPNKHMHATPQTGLLVESVDALSASL